MRKQQRSGKRPAHQAGQRMQSQICLAAGTVCGCTLDPYPRGWVRRAGPPALSGVFLPPFFLRRRRKNMAPGGRQPVSLEKIKTQKPASQKKSPKLQPQCVSNSAAASGLLTSYQGTDAATSLPGTPYHVHPQYRCRMQGWNPKVGSPPLAASFFPYSFFAGEERMEPPGGRLQSCRAALPIQPQKNSSPILLIQPRASGTTSLNCTNLTFSSLYYTV